MASQGAASSLPLGSRPAAKPALAVLALLVPLLAGGRPAFGQCTAPTHDTGFAEIVVNVNAGTFDQVLPFDVPIRLCGQLPTAMPPVNPPVNPPATPPPVAPAPATPPTLTVKYAEATNALSVDSKCKILAPSGAHWLPQGLDDKGELVDQPIPARIDGTTFRVVLPRLEAQRFYAFCFETQSPVSEAVAEAFRARARDIFDQELQQIPRADITVAESAHIRKSLRDKLLEVTGADNVLAPGSLFDTTIPAGQDELLRGGHLNELVGKVLAPQIQLANLLQGRPAGPTSPGIPSYAELQFKLRGSLEALRSDDALAHLSNLFEQQAQADPNLAKLVASDLAAPLAFPRRSAKEISLLAMGDDPAQPAARPLDETSDPAQASAAADLYDATRDTLDQLAKLISRVTVANDFPTVKAALSAAEVTELQALAAPKGPIEQAKGGLFRLAGMARNVQRSLDARALALDALADEAKIEAKRANVADASSTGNFDTFQSFYVSADAGFVYAPQIDTGVTYIGTNIYFRPVNRDAPLRQLGNFRQTFTRRFALTLGLTVQSVADASSANGQTRDNLFGNQALLVGAGLRITDTMRLGAGALVLKERDTNPLISRFRVASTYYFTLSFDLNVVKAFQGGLGGLF
jgi:hypothetical protein